MITFFRRFVFSFNIIAAIFLAGAYLSASISPKEAWLFALLGLAYPFLLLLNIFFALFWLFQFRLNAFFSIAVIAIGIPYFNQTFQFRHKTIRPEKEIRVLSYNAGLFGYFQSRWHVQELCEKANSIDADILCIQEFLNIRRHSASTFDSIRKACGFRYGYFQKLDDGRKKGEYGMAVFSKHPIRSTGLVHFDGLTGNMCFYTDIKIDTAVFRVYNVHLQSFKFKKQDYRFIEKLPEDNDEKIKQSKGLLKRMRNAYYKRAEQVEMIREHIVSSAYPHFVIGDFNDPPMSFSYAKLSRGLKDAFMENGSGMGKTYIGMMPNFRIDYILYPARFEGTFYKTYKLSSDHSLLSAGLKYKND